MARPTTRGTRRRFQELQDPNRKRQERDSIFGAACPKRRGLAPAAGRARKLVEICQEFGIEGRNRPFAARFLLTGRHLIAAENRPSRETPGQNGASSLVSSSPLLGCPKISPRFRFLGNFRPPRLRRRPGDVRSSAGEGRVPRAAASAHPMRATLPAEWISRPMFRRCRKRARANAARPSRLGPCERACVTSSFIFISNGLGRLRFMSRLRDSMMRTVYLKGVVCRALGLAPIRRL